MQFTNPIWLWGLSGLVIPIAIHLLSRKEGKIIKIGSVRHLDDTTTKQFKSIRLNELVLLTLRCLLITIIVFLLSGFHLRGLNQKSNWLLVEKGLEHDPEFSFFIDSLMKKGFEIKSFTNNFPDLRDSTTENEKINYWDLIEKLKTESLKQAIILSYHYAERFNGKRIGLPENIQWISKNPEPSEYALEAIKISEDSLAVRAGKSNSRKTTFFTKNVVINPSQHFHEFNTLDSIPIEFPDTLSIAIVNDPGFEYDKTIITAALNAIDKKDSRSFFIETFPTDKYSADKKNHWVIWLSNQLPPNINCSHISFQENDYGSGELFYQISNAQVNFTWILTQRLNEEIALEENLAVQLAKILTQSRNKKYQSRAKQFDRRVLPEKISEITSVPQDVASMNTRSSRKYSIIVFMLLLLMERWIAFKRNQ
jgi:hypothetical protein